MDPHDPDTDGDGVEDGTEGAGTVASFDATTGELVINVFTARRSPGRSPPDGDRVLERRRDQPDTHGDDVRRRHGDDDGPGDTSGADDGPGDDSSDDSSDSSDGPGHARDHGAGAAQDGSCTTADLVPGAIIDEAELDVTATGLVYGEIQLG